MKKEGQSLLELIIAIGVFVTVISGLSLFLHESFISGRLSLEITKAIFSAQEGLEAVRSIRDYSWDELITGNHGLMISGNKWILQGSQEDISDELRGGVRIIQIEDIDSDRKKITSKINWQFVEGRPQEIKLITYLTNWQKEGPLTNCTGTPIPCGEFLEETSCLNQDGCNWTPAYCEGTCTPCSELDHRPKTM